MPTDLEAATAALDRAVMDRLGDTIRYAADGAVFADLIVHADYRDGALSVEGTMAIAQDMTFSALKADLPVKPVGTARITLPKVAGRSFRPVNVRTDESGTGWEFELQEVTGG